MEKDLPNASEVDALIADLNGITEKTDLSKLFKEIANKLINHFKIVKDDSDSNKVITYRFMELEFYYCSPTHHDVITYPRRAEAGDWFFHSSGVDICFKSEVDLNEETGKVTGGQDDYGFGGILIRALSKQEVGKEPTYITGPLKCCFELFDQFSAFDSPKNFPKIEELENAEDKTCESCGRFFNFSTDLKTKLMNICQNNWEQQSEDKGKEPTAEEINKFKSYLKKDYCFFDKEAFEKFKEDSHQKAYNANPSSKKDRLNYKGKNG